MARMRDVALKPPETRLSSQVLDLADKRIPILVREFHGALHQYFWIPVVGLAIHFGVAVIDFVNARSTISGQARKGALPIFLCGAEACEVALFATFKALPGLAVFLFLFVHTCLSCGG